MSYYVTICGPADDNRKAILHRIVALLASSGPRLAVFEENVDKQLDPGLADELAYLHHDIDIFIGASSAVSFAPIADGGVIPRTVVGVGGNTRRHF